MPDQPLLGHSGSIGCEVCLNDPQHCTCSEGPDVPAWVCDRCGFESFCGYFASSTVCPMCPGRLGMRRGS